MLMFKSRHARIVKAAQAEIDALRAEVAALNDGSTLADLRAKLEMSEAYGRGVYEALGQLSEANSQASKTIYALAAERDTLKHHAKMQASAAWNAAEIARAKIERLQAQAESAQRLGQIRSTAPATFTPDEIARLVRLCHPDKHGGSAAATEITTKLLQLRKGMK